MVLITVMLRMVTQKSHRLKAAEKGMHRKARRGLMPDHLLAERVLSVS